MWSHSKRLKVRDGRENEPRRPPKLWPEGRWREAGQLKGVFLTIRVECTQDQQSPRRPNLAQRLGGLLLQVRDNLLDSPFVRVALPNSNPGLA